MDCKASNTLEPVVTSLTLNCSMLILYRFLPFRNALSLKVPWSPKVSSTYCARLQVTVCGITGSTHTRACAHTHTHTHTHTQGHACTHTHIHEGMHAYTQACTHTRTDTHTWVHIHTRICAHTYIRACAHIHIRNISTHAYKL